MNLCAGLWTGPAPERATTLELKLPQSGSPSIDLIWLGPHLAPPPWPLGSTVVCAEDPRSLHDEVRRHIGRTVSEGLLFWDSALGSPNPQAVCQASSRRGDLWHAGLRLGMGGLPRLLDFVAPIWMLNRDPAAFTEATSWRVSLRACLVRTSVLRRLGGPHPAFATLEGASLEFGHRCLTRGALTRHTPSLIAGIAEVPPAELLLEDELRFLHHRYGRFWACWAMYRASATGHARLRAVLKAARTILHELVPEQPPPFTDWAFPTKPAPEETVTVLIPTLDRYDYLRALLSQLAQQTTAPAQIIVVDQTPRHSRRESFFKEFSSLPLQVFYLDQPGQSSARNLGLKHASGKYVLFLDDDDEVPDSLIEQHLDSVQRFGADVSSGVVDEPGALPVREELRNTRLSDVFPTNNTMALVAFVLSAGGFDPAFDRAARADHDLGMRVYLGGAVMMLNQEVTLLHHHAATGGLRTHGARLVTHGSSRQKLMHRNLPSASEIYLANHYYHARQVREMLWMRAATTLRVQGSLGRRITKVLIGLALFPNTWRRIRSAEREASQILSSSASSLSELDNAT